MCFLPLWFPAMSSQVQARGTEFLAVQMGRSTALVGRCVLRASRGQKHLILPRFHPYKAFKIRIAKMEPCILTGLESWVECEYCMPSLYI